MLYEKLGLVTCVSFSDDGRYFTCGETGIGSLLHRLDYQQLNRGFQFLPEVQQFSFSSGSIAFSKNAKYVAYTSMISFEHYRKCIRLRYLEAPFEESLVLSTDDEISDFTSLTFSDDAKFLALGADTGWVIIYDLENNIELTRFQINDFYITKLEFSPDGKLLATCSGDGIIRLWDCSDTKKVWECGIDIGTLYGRCLAFSKDGRHLAIGFAVDSRGRSFKFPKGGAFLLFDCCQKTISELQHVQGGVYSIAFMREDKLALGLSNGSVSLFDLKSFEQVFSFEAYYEKICSLAISADGKMIAVCGRGPAKIFTTDPLAWIEQQLGVQAPVVPDQAR